MITLVSVIIIIAIVTVFSVQNSIPVAISFFNWKFEASLAVVIFLSVLVGVVIGLGTASVFRIKAFWGGKTSSSRDKERFS